jgi:hypothetical protein
MTDAATLEAIETELSAMGIGRGCWGIRKGKQRQLIISALVGGDHADMREVSVPQGGDVTRLKRTLRQLLSQPGEQLPSLAQLMGAQPDNMFRIASVST